MLGSGHVPPVGEQMVHRPQCQRADGAGGVHAPGGDERAAVDDAQVRHVVGHGPAVDDRTVAIVPHACGTHEVPVGGIAELDLGVPGAGLDERLPGLVDVPFTQGTGVVVDAVRDPWRRQPGAVGERRRKVDAVLRIGQVLAHQPPVRAAPEPIAHVAVVLVSPRPSIGQGRPQGSAGRRHGPLRATDESSSFVAGVELVGDDGTARMPPPALEVLAEQPLDQRQRMDHQARADQPRGVGQPVGGAGRGGGEKEARGADPVGRQEHHVGRLEMCPALFVDPFGAGGESARIGGDRHDARPGDEPAAGRHERRPMGQIGGALGALVAPEEACRTLDARVPARPRCRQDRVGRRPPVPSEPGMGTGDLERAGPDGERGQRGIGAVGEGRVAAQARDPELPIGALVEREQFGVGEGPVVGDTLVGPPREVRRQQSRPLGRVQDGAPAHAVVVEHAHIGGAQVDGVVRRGASDARVTRPQLAAGQLPLVARTGKGRSVRPRSLLQADDAVPGLDQAGGRDAAGCPRTDDQDVRRLIVSRCRAGPCGRYRGTFIRWRWG